jgi:SAM-dependent methyltransferase
MAEFYGRPERRALYQKMLASQEETDLPPGSPGDRLLAELLRPAGASVLEVGCSNGWLYRELRSRGFTGAYTGVEMADYVIQANRLRHPEARWEIGSAYALPQANGEVDACFAFYVLEHTVYPQRALAEMVRVVRPGGRCLLAFPDFKAIGFLPSQITGFSPGSTRDKWRAGQWWDAAVTLFDSRARVRPALRTASARFGPFPVNTRPMCLYYPDLMWADIDAVYIADKDEVAGWAEENCLTVEFPAGRHGKFGPHSFLALHKPLA